MLATTKEAAKHRSEIYKATFKHIKLADENGFYLESITLLESLLADRLESRLSYLLGSDFSFKTLGKIILKIKVVEKDAEILDLVTTALSAWADDRNGALHEMSKIAVGDISTWEERTERLKVISSRGLKLLRKIDRRIKALKSDQSH